MCAPCVCDRTRNRTVRANDSAHLFPEPCGTVCKLKLDCNTVRFKKFVMSHDRPCRAALIRDPLTPPCPGTAERMPRTPIAHAPCGPITVYSVDFARFRLHSVGYRGCALLSHVGGRWTVARSVARPTNDCQNHRTHFRIPLWSRATCAGSQHLGRPLSTREKEAGASRSRMRRSPLVLRGTPSHRSGSRVTSRPW